VKTDVLAAAQGRTEAPAGTVVTHEGRPFVSRPDTPMKLSQMRKAIARRMAQANTEIPHFYLRIVADMTQAVALRQQLGEAMPDVKISFNDIVVLAVARALQKHPEVNAYWDLAGQTIVRRGDIHIGIAVALDDGLIVPAVRHAEQKSLSAIAIEIRDLGTRAKDKKLAPEEMVGSTFTVSNLGMFGVEDFAAVINPGEGAILAVGAIVDEPVVIDGDIAVRKRMRVTMACDHRVMDGATGARFLATLRTLLEHPIAMLA
jgi:pyruvate dehydrogenase E2 component (dihydrolipoamide acetyltransferase)